MGRPVFRAFSLTITALSALLAGCTSEHLAEPPDPASPPGTSREAVEAPIEPYPETFPIDPVWKFTLESHPGARADGNRNATPADYESRPPDGCVYTRPATLVGDVEVVALRVWPTYEYPHRMVANFSVPAGFSILQGPIDARGEHEDGHLSVNLTIRAEVPGCWHLQLVVGPEDSNLTREWGIPYRITNGTEDQTASSQLP